MDADSAGELRTALEALEAQLRDDAEWLEKQKTPDDESPYRVFGPKRSALVLDAFRDALSAGAFADDEVMQDERARAFTDDVKEPAEPPMPRSIGRWIGYQCLGTPKVMFIERLLRGWLPLFDFEKARSQADVVDVPPFRVLTVKLYAYGLRCLARAVHVEIERRCPLTLLVPSESTAVVEPNSSTESESLKVADTKPRGWWPKQSPDAEWHGPLNGTKRELAHCVGVALRNGPVDEKTLRTMHEKSKSVLIFRVNQTSWQAFFHRPESLAKANAAQIELRTGKRTGANRNGREPTG